MALAEAVGVGGHDLDVERRHAELPRPRAARTPAPCRRPRSSVSTILPVGCTRRKTARYASSATLLLLLWVRSLEALALLMGSQRVVLLEVAERRLRPAQRVRRRRRAARSRGRCRLRLGSLIGRPTPGSCCRGSGRTRSASPPSCPAPASRSPTSPARRRGAGPGALDGRAADRVDDLAERAKLWPLTSASQCGSAASIPPARAREDAGAHARVDPHDPVREPREPLHLAPDERRVAALPAVGEDHHDRAARHPAPAVAVVERLQRVADPGAARPVGRRRGGARSARSGLRPASARVSRVRRVANTNASTCGPLPAAQTRNCR